MIVKDFQFANTFLVDEGLDYDPNMNVDIIWDGKKDVVIRRGKTIEIHQPTTVSKTLFNLVSGIVDDAVENPHKKDIFSLILHRAVHEYVYRERNSCEDNPPVLISGNKITIPTLIIRELIEPLIDKKIDIIPVLYSHCPFTDSCRIINSYMDIEYCDDFTPNSIPYTRYPLILANCSINNKASVHSHILVKQLEHNLGVDVTQKLLKKLLLNEEETLLSYLVKIVFTVEPDPLFVDDFLLYLKSCSNIKQEETALLVAVIQASYNKFPNLIKHAQNTNRAVEKQWTQWSTFMGLIEKQLGGYRGNKMETTELMMEVDDNRRKLRNKKRKSKGKKDLNFEDLLEVYREQYSTELAEPGTLHERLLQKNRIW